MTTERKELKVTSLGFLRPTAQRALAPPTAPAPPAPVREMPAWGPRTWDIPVKDERGQIIGFAKPDGTVWAGGKKIGTYDAATGQVTWERMGLGEQLGEAVKTVGLKALEWGFKPFELFEEYVAEPFATLAAAPFTPAVEGTEAMGWWERERKEYEEWREPVLFRLPGGYEVKPTKGLLELIPWFAIPPAAKVASLLGKIPKVGTLAAKALMPAVKAEALMGKVITIPLKVGGKVVGKIFQRKKFVTPELKAIDLIEAETAALHPERLATLSRWQRPFFTSAEWVKKQLATGHERTLKKAQVVERADFEVAQAAREVLMPELDKIGNHIRLFGIKEVPIEGTKISAELVTASWVKPKVEGASMALGDILRNPESYIFGASINGQKAKIWVDTYRKIIDALDERFGPAVRERLAKHGLTQRKGYAPFRVLAKYDVKTGGKIFEQSLYPAGTRPGARLPSQRPAVFKTQYEGMKAGYKYADSYRVLDDYIQELYNMGKGDRGIEIIGDMALTGKQRMNAEILARSKAYGEETKDLAYIKQALNRVKRGEKLPEVTIAAIERRMPDIGRELRAMKKGVKPKPEVKPAVAKLVIRDPEVKLAYDKAMQSLPKDIRSELDNVVRIRAADLEGRGGNVVELKHRFADIVVDKSEPDLMETVRHELLHAYLLKHPEKITDHGFFGLENTIREIVKAIPEVKPPAVKVPPEPLISPAEAAQLPAELIPPTDSIDNLLKWARERLIAVKAEARVFAPMYREARERAMTPALTEGRIVDIPAWMNRIFPDLKDAEGKVLMTGRDVAKRVEAIYAPDEVNRIIKKASEMARVGVTVKAALDLSWMFIQGSLVIGYDAARWATGKPSSAWFNGTKAMIKTMFNPSHRAEYMTKNSALIKEAIENGVIVERFSEFIDPGTIERAMKRIPVAGNFLVSLIRNTYGRAGAGFSTGGMVARTTIYRQARDSWVKEGHSLRELGEFVNKLTGVISSRELGVSATRRAVESATLFAPRYTRAYLMVMRDLLRGNRTGAEVRKAMAGMLVGGVLAYSTLATALGQEPKLNPAPKALGGDGAEFMSFKIAGSIIGLPGFWYSAIRMIAAVNAAAEEDPERLLSLNWRENDFLRWVMSKGSPLVGLSREIIEGKDFLGRRLDEPEDWLRHLSEYLMTIATVNLVTRHPSEEEGKFKRFGAELFGLRAFPRGDWDKLRDMKAEYSRKDFGKPFDELNLEERDKLLEAHPDYKQFSEEARDRWIGEKGEDPEVWVWQIQKEADAIYNAGVEDAAQGLLTGRTTYREYLDWESTLRKVYKGEKWAINRFEELADPDAQKELLRYLEEATPEDKALGGYWDIYGKDYRTEAGLKDWDRIEKEQDTFLASLDAETREYVERNKNRWVKDLPPIARQLAEIQVQGRDVVNEYYDQPDGKARLAYRRANPTVDAWLLVMGRVSVPQTPMAMQIAIQILREKGLPEGILVGRGEAGGVERATPRLSGFRQISLGSSRRPVSISK